MEGQNMLSTLKHNLRARNKELDVILESKQQQIPNALDKNSEFWEGSYRIVFLVNFVSTYLIKYFLCSTAN